jgi:excisionase family DNA binding protein
VIEDGAADFMVLAGAATMATVKMWWTVNELAEHYGLSPRTVYDVISTGELVAYRFGRGRGGTRVSDEDRRTWEQQCRDSKSVPALPPAKWHDRLAMSELVQKHFGT